MRSKFDRTSRHYKYRFHLRKSKKCIECDSLVKFHHTLCQTCWEERNKGQEINDFQESLCKNH